MRDEHYGIALPTPEQLQQRWEQSLAQFEFWVQIWRDNPQLAKQAGRRVEHLLMPLSEIHQKNCSFTA